MKKSTKKVWVIQQAATGVGFVMRGPDGQVFTGHKPRDLARLAWNYNADSVVHDYDLKLDPDH